MPDKEHEKIRIEPSGRQEVCVPTTEIPNEETIRAFESIDRREGLQYARDADDMFTQLGI